MQGTNEKTQCQEPFHGWRGERGASPGGTYGTRWGMGRMAQRMRCAKFMRAAEPVRRPGLSTVGLFAVTGPAMQGRTVPNF